MAVLLLQGPLGPFFKRLALALRKEGIDVRKINFNGGDVWYSRGIGADNFYGPQEDWKPFLRDYIQRHNITAIAVYGDCRLYHRLAREVSIELGIGFYAFEEGYIRPNHITFEVDGVNGYSGISAERIADWEDMEVEPELAIGNHLSNRIRYASYYYIFGTLFLPFFRHYRHHRSFSPFYEAYCWWRAARRHYMYKLTERRMLPRLLQKYDGNYFLFPLQVHNDAQIHFHSPYESIVEAIEEVVGSFTVNGRKEDCLVIKHHPMDRGHAHYGRLIKQLASKYQLGDRLLYLHDQHLPTLLVHARGVVTINSTTALQAFYHKASVKVLGDAFYNLPGICSQQSLQEFWQQPEEIDYDLFLRFRNYLSHNGQVNGAFYRYYGATLKNVVAIMKSNGFLQAEHILAEDKEKQRKAG